MAASTQSSSNENEANVLGKLEIPDTTTFAISTKTRKKFTALLTGFLILAALPFIVGLIGLFTGSKYIHIGDILLNSCVLGIGGAMLWVGITGMWRLNNAKLIMDEEGVELNGSLLYPERFLAWDEIDTATVVNTPRGRRVQLDSSIEQNIVIRDDFEKFEKIVEVIGGQLEANGRHFANRLNLNTEKEMPVDTRNDILSRGLYCPRCGASAEMGDVFCTKCGSHL